MKSGKINHRKSQNALKYSSSYFPQLMKEFALKGLHLKHATELAADQRSNAKLMGILIVHVFAY